MEHWNSARDNCADDEKMKVQPHNEAQIKAFCDQLEPVEEAYRGRASLSYCALLRDGKWQIFSAKLRLGHDSSVVPGVFKSPMVLARRVQLDNREISVRRVIDQVVDSLSYDAVPVSFEADSNGEISAYLVPHHRIPGERTAFATLKLRGGRSWEMVDRDEIGWHLRGAEEPYESLAELCAVFDAGDEPGAIEIVAAPAVRVGASSLIAQQQARMVIECSPMLMTNPCRISYRVLQGGEVTSRGSVLGGKLNWSRDGDLVTATHGLEIPEGAAVDCAASFLGVTHHQAWIEDRCSVQNPRRAAFEPTDADLEEMRVLLSIDNEKQHAKGFEAAVAWLLWMLGFNPTHLCNSGHHENGPDLLVECEGNIVAIECTLGQLKADKRSKLGARCVDIRNSLAASRNLDAHVLPVMVTRFSREQAQADIKEAALEDQHVLTRDDLLHLLDRTRQTYSAAAILGEWRRALEEAQARARRAALPIG